MTEIMDVEKTKYVQISMKMKNKNLSGNIDFYNLL